MNYSDIFGNTIKIYSKTNYKDSKMCYDRYVLEIGNKAWIYLVNHSTCITWFAPAGTWMNSSDIVIAGKYSIPIALKLNQDNISDTIEKFMSLKVLI